MYVSWVKMRHLTQLEIADDNVWTLEMADDND